MTVLHAIVQPRVLRALQVWLLLEPHAPFLARLELTIKMGSAPVIFDFFIPKSEAN